MTSVISHQLFFLVFVVTIYAVAVNNTIDPAIGK